MNPTSTPIDANPGDIVLVAVPYTDLSSAKKRPAVVLLLEGEDCLIAFMTSRLHRAGSDDVIVVADAASGRAADSAVLVHKLFTLHQSLIVRRLGQLDCRLHRTVVEHLCSRLTSAVS